MTLTEKLTTIKTNLLTVSKSVYHYEKPASVKAPYIVWMEDSCDTFGADNQKGENQLHGTIDAYSKTEFDSIFDGIFQIPGVVLNSVQYEDDTKLIHYEYEFWV